MPRLRMIWQLFPPYVLILLLSLLAVAWHATSSVSSSYVAHATEEQVVRIRLLTARLMELIAADQTAELTMATRALADTARSRITILRIDGVVITDSHESATALGTLADRPEIAAARQGQVGSDIRFNREANEDLLFVAVPVYRDGRVLAIIRTATSAAYIADAVRNLRMRIGLSGAAIGGIALLAGLWLSRRITRPLEELRTGAQRFARGDFSQRVLPEGSEETAALAAAMNDMARQLDARIQAFTQQRNEQEAILASMVEGLLAVDSQERLINFNAAAIRLLGEGQRLRIGLTIQEAIRNTDLQDLVTRTLQSDQPVEREIVMYEPVETYLQAYGSKLRDTQEGVIGALFVLHDVTRLRRLENVRRDFVANVSHELKTPITSIKGFVETLQEGAIREPADAERFLGIIARQADRLHSIIEDLLSLSRIEQEAEKSQIPLEQGHVHAVLTGAIEACHAKADERGLTITLHCPTELTATMNAVLLEQAVVNLIDNAIKYSDPGKKIEVRGERRAEEVVISVEDQGSGIEAQHLPRVWERFYRVDRARSRELGGTGLGLAIVKHIALAHGGQVAVTSRVGVGSTFRILLPH